MNDIGVGRCGHWSRGGVVRLDLGRHRARVTAKGTKKQVTVIAMVDWHRDQVGSRGTLDWAGINGHDKEGRGTCLAGVRRERRLPTEGCSKIKNNVLEGCSDTMNWEYI